MLSPWLIEAYAHARTVCNAVHGGIIYYATSMHAMSALGHPIVTEANHVKVKVQGTVKGKKES